jgi:type II secretory pathway component GspD/PulD (secretin)
MLVALRNMVDPSVKLYLISNRNSITVRADASEFPLIQQILDQIDLPKTSYRLTYTLTEMDAGKRIGTQHVALIVANGQRVTMKQGTKIPVSTGTYNSGTASSQTQMTYLDVGLNFDATLTGFDGGAELKSKVEQSGIAEEKSSIGPQDPVVRQTVIEGISLLTPGKPLILGSLDVPGSTRHLDIEVMMEVLK